MLTAKEIMHILLSQDDLDATEEASDGQYGLADKLLEELMDRTDIVKVCTTYDYIYYINTQRVPENLKKSRQKTREIK